VQTLVDRAHHARALLQHRNGRADRRLLVAVANLQIRDRRIPLPGLHHKAQKVKQRLIRTLERQRHDRIADRAARRVNIPELARLQRIVRVRDP
jgi:hypothetical protein